MWLSPSSKSVFVYQISSKSDDFLWDMAISRFSRWRISAILNFNGPIMGSLKSPCRTSYRLSIETIALNCLVFEKIEFSYALWRQTYGQTDEQIDSPDALRRSRYRERRLNKAAIKMTPRDKRYGTLSGNHVIYRMVSFSITSGSRSRYDRDSYNGTLIAFT